MGDQSIPLKFIFTGIGKTLDELLGAHHSAFRQLDTVELSRLSYEGRLQIVDEALSAFDLSIDQNVAWRIAMVSDGFPYYIQLITEKILWEAYSDDQSINYIDGRLYRLGLRKAIQSINAELKRPYEKATASREEDIADVVWATADTEDLHRKLQNIYESHVVISRKQDKVPLSSTKFSEIVRRLKTKQYGEILLSIEGRKSWYVYKEKMLRGYVRMQAESSGVELNGEKEAPKQQMHLASNIRTGYKGSSVPLGIKLRNEKN